MLKRLGIYLHEMFPLTAIVGSIITAVAVQLSYLRLFDVSSVGIFTLVIPGIVLTAVSLLIRIMDEFKDFQDDLTNFPSRPLPSGRVKKDDLLYLAYFCVFLIVFLSVGSKTLLIWALITLVFTFLMLKWFFMESVMRKSLPLAFITHHPIVLFNFVYLLLACTVFDERVTLSKAWMILPVCLIFTNWEVVRKIRAPEQETGYTTYSKIFGPRTAIFIALSLQGIFTVAVLNLLSVFSAPAWLTGMFILGQVVFIFPSLRFLFTLQLPQPLKPLAEGQILLVVLTILVSSLL